MTMEQLAIPAIDFTYQPEAGLAGVFRCKVSERIAREAVKLTTEVEGLPDFQRQSKYDTLLDSMTALSADNSSGNISCTTDQDFVQ